MSREHVYAQDVRKVLSAAVRTACEQSHHADLAGEDAGQPLRDLRRQIGYACREAERELSRLITHEHRWNEDGYCDICGMDGRA